MPRFWGADIEIECRKIPAKKDARRIAQRAENIGFGHTRYISYDLCNCKPVFATCCRQGAGTTVPPG